VRARRYARTVYVTGKGGAGKSLVATELAIEALARGRRVALVDTVDRTHPTTGFDRLPPKIEHVRLDPRDALRALLARLLRMRFLSDRLMDSRTFSAVAAAAPGLSDLVVLDAVREVAAGRAAGRFDLVIVNAAASGHSIAMLEAPRRIADLVTRGPVAAVARDARDFTLDDRFRVAVVALAEELAVAETNELHRDLGRLGVAVTPTVVNGVYCARSTAEQADWMRVHAGFDDARLYLSRRDRQLGLASAVASPAGAPVLVPYLFDGARLPASDRGRLLDALVPDSR
jgi:hypothetical protein